MEGITAPDRFKYADYSVDIRWEITWRNLHWRDDTGDLWRWEVLAFRVPSTRRFVCLVDPRLDAESKDAWANDLSLFPEGGWAWYRAGWHRRGFEGSVAFRLGLATPVRELERHEDIEAELQLMIEEYRTNDCWA